MYHIIVNPASRSGKGQQLWEEIESVFKESGVEYTVYFSKNSGHIIELSQNISSAVLNNNPSAKLNLVVLGGDGTINEALQGVCDFSRTNIGYIPTGSSNDLARDMKLPKDQKDCARNIINCKTPYKMDLGILTYKNMSSELSSNHSDTHIDKRYFDVSSGIGFDAAVCEEIITAPLKNILNKIGLGKLIYLVIALKQIFTTQNISAKITFDNNKTLILKDFLFATFMIHKYEGGGFKFCPDADCTDGFLDLCAISGISKFTFITSLPKAKKGNHTHIKGATVCSAKEINIETSVPCWVHTDGEVTCKSSSINITCLKQAINFLM